MDKILFRGSEYEIKYMSYAGKMPQLIIRDHKFHIYVNSKTGEEKRQQIGKDMLRQWMIEQAQEILGKRVGEYAGILGIHYEILRIKDTKTRWGSCSSKKNLNFNFRLVMAPEPVMEYVIVRELCHLLHMNHSSEFWDAVAGFMPDYEKHKRWLKENGIKLYQI